MPLVAAIDVGTGSARAGIFDAAGRLLARAEHPTEIFAPAPGHAEQESTALWQAACAALKSARAEAAARPEAIAALAFDATCSLVLRDAAGRPLTASTTGDDRRDTILWLDHRAIPEAEAITATAHPSVALSGGAVSPEMQLPKLLWLKRHLPDTWARLGLAIDLADFLAWRATGNPARSRCTVTCKWNHLPDATPAWPHDLLGAIGLADLLARAGLPEAATPVAADLGPLTPEAARDLGLTPATRVATGLIDAHAGALGVLGHLPAADLPGHAALIGGTSACLMTLAAPKPIPGIWGPYPGAVLPGLPLSEGGLSAAGALLDHLLRLHGHAPEPAAHARVIARVGELRVATPDLAPDLHVVPDFLGRRSPDPDPYARGTIAGLPLDASFDALCRLYWRACLGIALGIRAVLEHLRAHGVPIDTLHVTGGHTRNPLLMQLYADATACRTVEPAAPDAVLLGTAMVAATAAGLHPSLAAASAAMHQPGTPRAPDPAAPYEGAWQRFRSLRR
ncbi:MAG: FGGY family pentulose kinase [Amaricoccus sp.]